MSDAKVTARGPYAATPAKRAHILRAAMASFAEHGYDRSSLRGIAARAGITHAGLLHHFTGKDELLTSALEQHESDERRRAAEAMNAGVAESAVLSTLLAAEFDEPEDLRPWLALTVQASDPAHPAHAFFAERRERARDYFRRGARPTSTNGVTLDEDEKAVLVLAIVDGLRLQALMDPSQDYPAVLTKFMALVLDPTPEHTTTSPRKAPNSAQGAP